MYRHVVVAGTFDRLHKGHVAVLRRAFAVGERVTIGLTTDAFVRRYKLDQLVQLDKLDIKEYAARKKALELWLAVQNYAGRAAIVPLDDPYGFVVPARNASQRVAGGPQSSHDAAVPDVEAVVVSMETRGRAEEINRLRKEAGWKPLAIVEVAMVQAEDLAVISSTRIRKGQIDRDGRLTMPDNLRPELQKPLGRVLVGEQIGCSLRFHLAKQGETFLVTVGDMATKTLLDMGIVPALAIIDGKVGRKPFSETRKILLQKVKPFQATTVKSGPGYISGEATRAIKATLATQERKGTHTAIIIDGEEDLLALPAIAQAPIGSVVYYGQPNQGLVEVVVTEEKRQETIALLAQFLS